MTKPSIAIRLGTEGGSEVRRDIEGIGTANEASANRAKRAWERASDDIEAAQRRQAAAAAKIAAIMPVTSTQMRVSDTVGTGYGQYEGSARASAAAFREAEEAQARYEQGALRLRAAIDPAFGAQQRFNTQMAEARTLVSAGAISLDDYCAKLRMEKAALDQVATGHNQVRATSGAVSAGVQQLTLQAGDMATMWAMNAPPMQIFVSQAAQVTGALGLMTSGSQGLLAWLGTPWGQAFMGAATVAAILGVKLLDSANAADNMASRQSILADMVDKTTGRLKEQNQALLQNQIMLARKDAASAQSDFNSTRQQLRNMRPGDADLANIARFAAETGQTSRAAQMLSQLSAAKPWLADQAQSMNNMLADMTTQARTIVQAQAQTRLLSGSGRTGDAKRAFGDFSSGGGSTYNMAEINAQAKLAAAVTAVDKAQANLTLTRQKAEEQLKAGKITEEQATAQIASAERQLDQAQAAETARRQATAAGRKADREAERDREEALRKIIALERERNGWINDRAREGGQAAIEALNKEGEKLKENQRVLSDMRADTAAGTALLNIEWQLRRENRDVAADMLELERYRLDIMRQFPGATAEQIAQLLEAKKGQIEMNRLLEDYSRNWEEMKSFGEGFVDTVLSPDTWSSWGNAGKTILGELQNEMLKLAVINPLKNALFGSGLPTLGSISSLFKGSGSSSDIVLGGAFPGNNAVGTEYWSGGMTYVGEQGRELINLPRGSKVFSASDTRQMQQQGAHVTFEVRPLKGATFDAEVSQISGAQVAQAAPTIAAGSSNGAQQAMMRRNSRRLA